MTLKVINVRNGSIVLTKEGARRIPQVGELLVAGKTYEVVRVRTQYDTDLKEDYEVEVVEYAG